MSKEDSTSAPLSTHYTETPSAAVASSTEAELKDTNKDKEADAPEVKVERSASPLLKKQKTEPTANSVPHDTQSSVNGDEPSVYEVVGGSSIRRYLNAHVTKHLLEGLKEVGSNKPEDPLSYLGRFLIERAKELDSKPLDKE